MSLAGDGGVAYTEPQEMTLRDYIAVVKRRKWFVIVPALLATAIALSLSMSQTPRYRAEADVLVKRPPTATQVGVADQAMTARELQNELLRARGSAMQAVARESIGGEPELSVRLAADDDADVLVFTAESRSDARAADAANAYANAYINERRTALTGEYTARAEVLQQRIVELNEQLELIGDASDEQFVELVTQRGEYQEELQGLLTSISLAQQSGGTVIDAARIPESPFEPTPVRSGVLALVVGLLIGLGAAFLVDYLDRSVRDEEDLAGSTRLPILAVIPKLKGWKTSDTHVVTREDPSSPPAEAYRALRTSIQFLRLDRTLDLVQVTSPKPGDGKTTTSTNLAVACARAGQQVILVDCDLRRPRVHHFFGLTNDVGFTSVLMGAAIESAIQKVDGEPNMSVMPSGPIPPDPSELLSSERSKALIEALKNHFDLVVLDSPPVLVVADPLVLSGVADGVVLVASAGKTDRDEAARAAELLGQVNAPMLGTVLNAFEPKNAGSYEYRYAYGSYGQT